MNVKFKYKVFYYCKDKARWRAFKSYDHFRDFVDELLNNGEVFESYEYDSDFESFIKMVDLSNQYCY